MTTLDARGISCPEPLIMLKNALNSETELILLLDSRNALENCSDFARKQGFDVSVTEEQGDYKVQVSAKK